MTRLGFLRRAMLAPRRSLLANLGWGILAVAVPTALRELLQPVVGQTVPYATFYPAVLIAALLLGPRVAVVVTLVSAVVVNYLFVTPRFSIDLGPENLAASSLFILASGLIILTAQTLRRTIRDLEASAARESQLNAELAHRVKNNLAVVQAMAFQTARASPGPEQFYPAFRGRLHALAEAHNLLTTGRWEACELPELAFAAVRPFREQGTMKVEGPHCRLPMPSCVPLVLALHELGTNAAKYGALSTTAGCVEVTWRLEPCGAGFRLKLRWLERNGPPVDPPMRRGLGSRLLAPQSGLDTVDLDFRREGLVCEIGIGGAAPADEPLPRTEAKPQMMIVPT